MRRKLEIQLDSWYGQEGRKPLILRGARQVGKSTLVRNFAKAKNLKLFEINCERFIELNLIFKTLDMKLILRELSAIVEDNILKNNSLLFLDEIQATPNAFAALRYFYEDLPHICVIAAGSLLEFTLAEHEFSMPVGRIRYLHMGPMVFSEFLWATNPYLYEQFIDYQWGQEMAEALHVKFSQAFREYLYVGGMPEAVDAYAKHGDVFALNTIHDSILDTYIDDFSKYASSIDPILIKSVFQKIPVMVGKKIIYSHFSRDYRSSEIKKVLQHLEKARVCHMVHHTDANGVPLGAEVDEHHFKILFLDIGLMNRMLKMSLGNLAAMHGDVLVNEGSIAEQTVGQHLLFLEGIGTAPKCYTWQREGKQKNAEVDYIISLGREVIPLEVKAGTSGSLKSLHQFMFAKNGKRALRLDANRPSSQHIQHRVLIGDRSEKVEFELLSIPLYFSEKIAELLTSRP